MMERLAQKQAAEKQTPENLTGYLWDVAGSAQ